MDFEAPPLERFSVLTFDCYGTLIDWERGLCEFGLRFFGARTANIEADVLLEAFGRLESECEAATPTSSYRAILGRVMVGLGEHFDVAVSESETGLLAESLANWPPFDDSRAALGRLAESHRLGIVSNVDPDLFAGSQRQLGVDFDPVVTALEAGSYKPALAHFEVMLSKLEALGYRPSQVLHVAQSLYHDHAPAKKIGLTTCWVDRRSGLDGFGATPPPREAVTPDYRVPSLGALLASR